MSAPQVKWEAIGYHSTADRHLLDLQTGAVSPMPNTWVAEFGAGYLVVHASPSGAECMVYVPHEVSGLGPPREYGEEVPF